MLHTFLQALSLEWLKQHVRLTATISLMAVLTKAEHAEANLNHQDCSRAESEGPAESMMAGPKSG